MKKYYFTGALFNDQSKSNAIDVTEQESIEDAVIRFSTQKRLTIDAFLELYTVYEIKE